MHENISEQAIALLGLMMGVNWNHPNSERPFSLKDLADFFKESMQIVAIICFPMLAIFR